MLRKGVFKAYSNYLNLLLRLVDWCNVLVLGVLSFYLSNARGFYLQRGVDGLPEGYLYVIAIAVIFSALVFPMFAIYRVWRGVSTLTEIKNITMAWGMVAFLMALLAFVTQTGADFSRSWMGLWFAGTWVAFIASRVFLRLTLRWLRSNGYNHRHIVIVGTGEQAMVVAQRLKNTTWFGLEIQAFFSPVAEELIPSFKNTKLISDYVELHRFVKDNQIDQVWIALPHTEESTIRQVVDKLDGITTQIKYVPDIFGYQLMNHSLTEMAGVPVVNISYSAIDGANRYVKAFEDYALSLLLLLFAAPLMLLIAAGVKLTSPGPVLYRQKRLGWNGKEFTMLKYRTMPVEAERETGPVWASQQDSRATSFGAFLRKTSLDELPQLFNVLKGEMSLIGPRPERPVFVEQYKDEVPHYMKKHLVKAGVTGWAQVHGWRGNTCLHTRIEHDLYYIENWSLWLDIKIIIMTVFRGLVHKNAY